MKNEAKEILVGQKIMVNGYVNQSYRILEKVKETPKTVSFLVNHYTEDNRCVGPFTKKVVTFRKSTILESREDTVGTKFGQLHRIKSERLLSIINRGFDLYKVKSVNDNNYEGYDIGDYVFAKFNGINYVTECILDEVTINAIPPSKNSDKPQLSKWSNTFGGFEDFYEIVDMKILLAEKAKNKLT